MNIELQHGGGVKPFCSKAFSLVDKIAKILFKDFRLLRQYGTKNLKSLSALVPDVLLPLKKMAQKTLAFTLAETLIVMGVIGIVSALTLPNLNSSTGDKEKVAKVKKIYQNLTDAFDRAQAVYGPFDQWFVNDTTEAQKSKRAGERITEFMKVSKDCGLEQNKGCFTSGWPKALNGDDMIDIDNNSSFYKIITADGTSVAFYTMGTVIAVHVDIDGPNKGPYTSGKDVFEFANRDAGGNRVNAIYPYGIDFTFADLLGNLKSDGYCAATWIINYDNMDYLKCPDKLSETVTTCK